MAVNVIKFNEAKPAPEIVHPLLSNRESQIERGRYFLLNDSGDHLVSTVALRAIPDLGKNNVCKVTGDGESWVAVIQSFTLSGSRSGVNAQISLKRPA